MSEPAVRAELQITLKDTATAGLNAVTQAAEKSASKTAAASVAASTKSTKVAEESAKKITATNEEVAKKYVMSQKDMQAAAIASRKRIEESQTEAIRRQEAMEKSAIGKYAQNMDHRRTLGIRSENEIQKEISKTEEAYKKLAGSGVLSAQQQERALDAMKKKVTALTNEMGKLTAEQKRAAGEAANFEKINSRLRYGVAGAAGVAAAAYTLKAPAMDAMTYDRLLANMANTAYAERDVSGRKIGMSQLENAINRARKEGGGTRESAAGALDTMIASGVVNVQDAIQMLPEIMKTATAGNADPTEIAKIAIRAQQTFKIKPEELSSVLSGALAAGQAGGFELKDMAKWLPQQMAMAGNLGITGKEGFAKLASWNQASVITAGTKDEAGNNLRDLLMEVNTPHFLNFMATEYLANGKKAKSGEKQARLGNIEDVFLNYQKHGVDKVDATIDMAQKIFAKNRKYTELQAKLAVTGKDDKEGQRAILESMSAQVQGTAIGKIFHNQQSLMAFLGLMNNQKYVDEVLGKVRAEYTAPAERNATSVAQGVVSSTSSYKLEQAGEDKKLSEKAAMDSLAPAIGRAAEMFSDMVNKYPLLTGAGLLVTGALTALAGAAGLASLAMGGKDGGAIAKAALKYGPGAGKLLKGGGIAGVGALAGDYALGAAFGEESAISRYGSSALNGAAAGGLIGSFVPVAGTAIGAGVGGVIGLLYEALKPAVQKPVDVNAKMTVNLAPGLVLQNQTMKTSGSGNVQMNTGNVVHGAPG